MNFLDKSMSQHAAKNGHVTGVGAGGVGPLDKAGFDPQPAMPAASTKGLRDTELFAKIIMAGCTALPQHPGD